MLYLDEYIRISICGCLIFCRWYQRATPHRLSASSAFASNGQHRSYCKRFSMLRIIEWL